MPQILNELFSAAVVNGRRRGDVPLEPPPDAQLPDGEPLGYAAIRYEVAHAPTGGVTIGGKHFVGGQFIPGDVMAGATPEEKAKLSPPHIQDASGKPLAKPKPTIEVTPGLEPAAAKTERETREFAHANYPQLRETYLRGDPTRGIPPAGTFDPATGSLRSVALNTDEWRALLPGYVGTNSSAVHEAASWLNGELYGEMLREQVGKGNNQFMVLAGGGGSGKGTAVGDFFSQTEHPLVLDQVSDRLERLESKLDEARAHGYDPVYVFVDRPPEGALSGVSGRAINLRKKGKLARTVNLDIALKANIESRRTALELLKRRHDIAPNIIDNRGQHAGQLFSRRLITDRDEAISYLQTRLQEDEAAVANGMRERVRGQIMERARSGEIPPDIADGLLGPGWDKPADVQDAAGKPIKPKRTRKPKAPSYPTPKENSEATRRVWSDFQNAPDGPVKRALDAVLHNTGIRDAATLIDMPPTNQNELANELRSAIESPNAPNRTIEAHDALIQALSHLDPELAATMPRRTPPTPVVVMGPNFDDYYTGGNTGWQDRARERAWEDAKTAARAAAVDREWRR